MKWLGASMLVASWMLCCWTVVAFVLLPWHHLIFRLTPTASAYASRVVIDQQIVRYLVSGNQATLGGLTPLEQAHMVDVRTVWLGFIVYVLLLGIALPIIGRIRRSTSTLSTGTFQAAIRATQRAILVVGAVSFNLLWSVVRAGTPTFLSGWELAVRSLVGAYSDIPTAILRLGMGMYRPGVIRHTGHDAHAEASS